MTIPSRTTTMPTETTIATGKDQFGSMFVRLIQADQTCELTLPELKEILRACSDVERAGSVAGTVNIFDSSKSRLDVFGKYICRKVEVRLIGGLVHFDVYESGLDEIKDTSMILSDNVGQVSSGRVQVERAFVEKVVAAVEKR